MTRPCPGQVSELSIWAYVGGRDLQPLAVALGDGGPLQLDVDRGTGRAGLTDEDI